MGCDYYKTETVFVVFFWGSFVSKKILMLFFKLGGVVQ